MFNQLCVWEGTVLGDCTAQDFENFFMDMGFTVKFMEEVDTLPDMIGGEKVEGTGGRTDLLFYIADEDVMKFAIPRLQYGIRWWEDVFFNNQQDIYPDYILEKYPKRW